MRRRALLIGIMGGLLLGGIIGALRGPLARLTPPAAPLGEDGGRISRVVMHYQPDAGPLAMPIYRQWLAAMRADVEVVWVAAQQADLDDLPSQLGSLWRKDHHRGVVVGKPISTWSKDRFVAMHVPGRRNFSVSCAPARTRTANPLRTNDQEAPYCLAQQLPQWFGVRDTTVDFDGGDFLATAGHLFASPAIIEKNAPSAGARFPSAAALADYLGQQMGRPITWVGGERAQDAPPHHLGMFLTVIGQRAAVGDIRLAEQAGAAHAQTLTALQAAGGEASPAFRADLQTRLDRVARQFDALGYTVVRVPLLPSATPRAWMSYNNGIVETRDGHAIFYMPTFGAAALDAEAAATFRAQMGCTVVPIDCATIWPLGGSLHCLVNVVGR